MVRVWQAAIGPHGDIRPCDPAPAPAPAPAPPAQGGEEDPAPAPAHAGEPARPARAPAPVARILPTVTIGRAVTDRWQELPVPARSFWRSDFAWVQV